jgi:hypothetical protein
MRQPTGGLGHDLLVRDGPRSFDAVPYETGLHGTLLSHRCQAPHVADLLLRQTPRRAIANQHYQPRGQQPFDCGPQADGILGEPDGSEAPISSRERRSVRRCSSSHHGVTRFTKRPASLRRPSAGADAALTSSRRSSPHPRTFLCRGEAEAFRGALQPTHPELSRITIMIPGARDCDKLKRHSTGRFLCITTASLHKERTAIPQCYPHACGPHRITC